jgi:hypothetical protein
MFMKYQKNALILAVYYFYYAAPTCFDTYVSSSGSSSVPAKLHENRMQWLMVT